MRALALCIALLCCLTPSLPAAGKEMDSELTRAYAVLGRGEVNRAKSLFKAYLAKKPENQWAREGYVEAGGSLKELGLEESEAVEAADAHPMLAEEEAPAASAATSEAPPAAAPADQEPSPWERFKEWFRDTRLLRLRLASGLLAGLALAGGLALLYFQRARLLGPSPARFDAAYPGLSLAAVLLAQGGRILWVLWLTLSIPVIAARAPWEWRLWVLPLRYLTWWMWLLLGPTILLPLALFLLLGGHAFSLWACGERLAAVLAARRAPIGPVPASDEAL